MIRARFLLPAIALFPTVALLAQGGPPLITDDTATPGDGVWEVNLAFTTEKGAGHEWFFETPLVDINYGIGERFQLKFEVPWVILHEDGGSTKNDLGNSVFGVKWRFLDQESHGVGTSVYPQFSFNNPTSAADRGLVDDGTELFLPFELEKRFGPFSVNPEVGFVLREEGREEWAYGLALGYDVFETVELVGEVHGEAEDDLDRHALVFNVGTRWEITENCRLLLSAGRGVRGTSNDEPELLVYSGLQFFF